MIGENRLLMPIAWIRRKVRHWWERALWSTLLILIGVVYGLGFWIMWWQEAATNPIRSIGGYSWWFIATISTTGYGDIVPATSGGRWAGGIVIVAGFVVNSLIFGKIIDQFLNWRRKGLKGQLEYAMENHIVIFGNRGLETSALIQKLVADRQTIGRDIVLCSHSTTENPFPSLIRFVHGSLTSEDVMQRASVAKAAQIIIHAHTDEETAFIALVVKDANRLAHIVVNLDDPDKERILHRIEHGRLVCIKPVDVAMMVREIHNPGISQVMERLLASEGQDLRSLEVPRLRNPLSFGSLGHRFREEHGAILVGMRAPGSSLEFGAVINPPFDARVESGASLYYISQAPLDVVWEESL